MNTTQDFRGVYTIPVTPFNADQSVDEHSLRRQVDWCVEAGAHGIVAPANAGESPSLTDDERLLVTRAVVETVSNRIPVVIGVSGVSPRASILYTQFALEVGADAVMAMPPYGIRFRDPESILAYFQVVAEAADGLPVFIQNWSGPFGTVMSAQQLTRIMKQVPNVSYLKEETASASHIMTTVFETAGDSCKGIMGGTGARYVLDEARRGACGTMPAAHTTDVNVAIWNYIEAGEFDKARSMFNRLLPLLNMEAAIGVPLYKEVMFRRGIIPNPAVRGRAYSALDKYDHEELDTVLKDVSQLFSA